MIIVVFAIRQQRTEEQQQHWGPGSIVTVVVRRESVTCLQSWTAAVFIDLPRMLLAVFGRCDGVEHILPCAPKALEILRCIVCVYIYTYVHL